MKRYWYTNGNFIEADNGEIMASSEVLPEIKRLNAHIAELESQLRAQKTMHESELRECEAFWEAQKIIKES